MSRQLAGAPTPVTLPKEEKAGESAPTLATGLSPFPTSPEGALAT